MNRKATEFDIIFIMGVALAMMATMLLSAKIFDVYKGSSARFLNTSTAGEAAFKSGEFKLIPMLDNVFFAMFAGLGFVAMVSALFIRTHPVIFIISLFLVAIALLLAGLISRVSDTFTDGPMASYTNINAPFAKTNFIMDNLPMIVLGFSVLLLILLYSFGRSQVFG